MSNSEFLLAESISTSTSTTLLIAIYLLVLVYCCFGLAVVCDEYFVPALQKLSYTYNLPPDIAGSTLMALGASVPELFASLIGVFVTEDDIGTGSIIGSSCFNLIAVPAACGLVASAACSKKLVLSPTPIIRNSAFYAITILVLLLIIKDNIVDMLEASILLIFFVMYMGLILFSAKSSRKNSQSSASLPDSLTSSYISTDSAIAGCNNSEKEAKRFNQHNQDQGFTNGYQDPLNLQQQNLSKGALYLDLNQTNNHRNQIVDERTPLVSLPTSGHGVNINPSYCYNQSVNSCPPYSIYEFVDQCDAPVAVVGTDGSVRLPLGIAIKNSTCLVKPETEVELRNPSGKFIEPEEETNWVSSKWILIPMLPVTLSMKLLTPCKFKNTCWTIWTFLVSIALIGGLTYVSVWAVHLFGQTVGIPETVAGMTILSWGTGVPELIASIVLIKKTMQADMAICNTIGSNVIDVSFCLGLPWIVKCILNKSEGLEPEVSIQSAALPWTSFLLLVTVVVLLLVLNLNKWVLDYKVGLWLSIVYVAFVCVATYLEYSFSEKGFDLLSIF